MQRIIRRHLELFVWALALAWLAFVPPSDQWSLCLFRNLGLDVCPGCGLGRSIHEALNGAWAASLDAHVLGIAVAAALIARTITLTRSLIRQLEKTKTSNYERTTNLLDSRH